MKRFALLSLLPLMATAAPALAQVDAACKPVIAAGKAKAAAQAFHDRKNMGGTTIEAIKVGDSLYSNTGQGWKLISTSASKTMAAFDAQVASGSIKVSNCKKLGRETIDGHSTTIYQYTTAIQDYPAATAKVWIGDDGLPYADGSETEREGTVTYTGVTAPDIKPKKK